MRRSKIFGIGFAAAGLILLGAGPAFAGQGEGHHPPKPCETYGSDTTGHHQPCESPSPSPSTSEAPPTTDSPPVTDSPSPSVTPSSSPPVTSAPPTTVRPSTPVLTPSRPVATPRITVRYANCAAVVAAGRAPLLRGQPGYRAGLDRDNDGVACEVSVTTSATPVTASPTPIAVVPVSNDSAALASTGTNTVAWTIAGLAFVGLGGSLLWLSRREKENNPDNTDNTSGW